MKSIIIFCLLIFVLLSTATPQQVIIKGTLRCMNNEVASSTRGAVNIIIVPSFNHTAAVATTTTPQGFFQINTGWNVIDLKDKNVSLYIITKCSNCKNVQRIFISEDLDKRNTDPSKMYITVKNWKLLENCKASELPDLLSEKLLDSAQHLPALTVEGKAPGSPALAPVSFINLFQKLVTAVATANSGLFKAISIQPGKIKYGRFLQSSALTNTDNTGFNFSPSRNLSEAVFWNAAAIANSSKPNNISLLSNFKNNIKLSGYQQISKQFYLGVAGIYTKQDELRQFQVIDVSTGSFTLDVRYPEKLKEFAVFLSPVYAINNNMSVGVTIKSVWQQFNNPYLVAMEQDGITKRAYNFFKDDSINQHHYDADLSFCYKINSFLQAGISLMNVTGTKLHADVFIRDSAHLSFVNQRTYGVGLCYKRGRLNVGVDALFTEKELYDAAVGVNYVPFNDALIAAGYAIKQKSFSATLKLKHFKIAYINDNNLVINAVNVGKNKVFNGKIYSGFLFDF